MIPKRLLSTKEAHRAARAAAKFKGKTSCSVQGITVRTGKVIIHEGKFIRFEED